MPLSPVTARSTASLRGLNTDGNALSDRSETNLAEANYEIMRDGTRRRRRPLIQETSVISGHRRADTSFGLSTYLWRTPGRESDTSVVVEEANREIRFYVVDHDTAEYVRANPLSEVLKLDLFGSPGLQTIASHEDVPSTFSEGNGNLYVFNKLSGTIRVEYNSGNLLFTPINTWVRDFEGAAEDIAVDQRLIRTTPENEYSPGVPYYAGSQGVQVNEGSTATQAFAYRVPSDLPPYRAYNLSNTGWEPRAIQTFQEGETPYLPAYADQYLDGRLLQPDGTERYDAEQARQARRRDAIPPTGARVTVSGLRPAGTLNNEPFRHDDGYTTVFPEQLLGTPIGLRLRTRFITPQRSSAHSAGVSDENFAMFVHMIRGTVTTNEGTFQWGFSGVIDGRRVPGESDLYIEGTIPNAALGIVGTVGAPVLVEFDELYMYGAPIYFPHQVKGAANRADYRRAERPGAGTFYAGRLWQADTATGSICFSQIVPQNATTAGDRGVVRESMCYQQADPTDGDDNALTDADGGTLKIDNSGTVLDMHVISNMLYILCDNGIWVVQPGERGVFSPSDFRVSRISRAEVLGPRATVVAEDTMYVGTSIGVLQMSSEGMRIITDDVIREQWDELMDDGRTPVCVYDHDERVIRWMFPRRNGRIEPLAGRETVGLNLHLTHGSWYRYTWPDAGVPVDFFVLPYTAEVETYNRVRYLIAAREQTGDILNDSAVTTEWGVEVEFGADGVGTWVQTHNPEERFADFLYNADLGPQTEPRPPTPAFMLTNHMVYGEANKFTQINYLVAYNRNVTTAFIDNGDGSVTENVPGGTLVQPRWDWTNGIDYGKYGPLQQTYRFRRSYFPENTDYDRQEPVLVTKTKMRGRGRELRLYWEAEGHADSHIEGWAIEGMVLLGV